MCSDNSTRKQNVTIWLLTAVGVQGVKVAGSMKARRGVLRSKLV